MLRRGGHHEMPGEMVAPGTVHQYELRSRLAPAFVEHEDAVDGRGRHWSPLLPGTTTEVDAELPP